MELKQVRYFIPHLLPGVLIAPLWNWNVAALGVKRVDVGFNRTFMELKRRDMDEASRCPIGFNRTFMELKRDFPTDLLPPTRVLIAPLWNWNCVVLLENGREHPVLIAPLWNWNCRSEEYPSPCRGFNRTFMELKPSAPCRRTQRPEF